MDNLLARVITGQSEVRQQQEPPERSGQLIERQSMTFLLAVIVCLASVGVALWMIDRFAIQTFFFISFIGYLIIIEIFAPYHSTRRWWVGIQRIKIVGWLLVLYFVIQRVLPVIQ